MSSKLIPIDPNNIKHIEFLEEFNAGSYNTPIGIIKPQEDNNDISMELLLEEKNNITDICHLQGVKDMKQCFISCLEKDKKKRKIIPMATLYAMNTLGMEEVFIKIKPDDKNMLEYLFENNYECLGDEKGSIVFLKEKED